MDTKKLRDASAGLFLTSLPPVFIFPTHVTPSKLDGLKQSIVQHGASIPDDVTQARLFFGQVGTKQRAQFELRCRGVWTEEMARPIKDMEHIETRSGSELPRKRRRVNSGAAFTDSTSLPFDEGSCTESDTDNEALTIPSQEVETKSVSSSDPEKVRVLKLSWIEDSIKAQNAVDLEPYVVYEGRIVPRPEDASTPVADTRGVSDPIKPAPGKKSPILKKGEFKAILARAKADAVSSGAKPGQGRFVPRDQARGKSFRYNSYVGSAPGASQSVTRPTHLLHETTSEHDETSGHELPEMPLWVKQRKKYACERPTPLVSLNDDFLAQLDKIKLARLLTGDEIGVRAYSTSIASLAAYPHRLGSTREVVALPGCDTKIAHLWQEWKDNDGHIQAVDAIDEDERIKVLRLFWEIWGVGAVTAREFYAKGWRDLDDIIEYGWKSLSRVQQIGVKYYEEFLVKIPRNEVESIAATVVEHAKRVRDDGIECCIVGGYRRGKKESGDVDMILSHRDLSQTLGLVHDIVVSLEEAGWITHTLLMTLTNTKRNQQPLAFRQGGAGSGFDTLDKALVVWQDPNFTPSPDATEDAPVKNPNIHRRVDIIIAPWSTVGCGITGWSGGTTFQRDLRRYAKNVKNMKFDSSGIRDRGTGEVVELESVGGLSRTWQEAERKVFEGMGLEYREPWERCTG